MHGMYKAGESTMIDGEPGDVIFDIRNRLRTASEPSNGSLTERSSTIAAGGTSQQLVAANTARKYLLIQNLLTATGQGIGAAESLFIRFGATAAVANNGTSYELVAGASFVMENNYVSTQACQIIGATSAHRYICVEG